MIGLLGIAFAVGKPGIILLFAFASFAGLREFLTLTPTYLGLAQALESQFNAK